MAKKFLDEQGLTTLWGLIKDKLSAEVGDVKDYVDSEIGDIQDAFENGGVKNPYALTFKNSESGLNNITYDGSEAKEINLSASALGAVDASRTASYDGGVQGGTTIENTGASFSVRTSKNGDNTTTFMIDKDGAYINNQQIVTQDWAENNFPKLDENDLIPTSFLPSYVDDVVEYSSKTAFPTTGETGKIYVAKDTNIVYRWSGSTYVEISSSLALGETSSTAYAGDKGKANATNIAILQGYFSSGIAKQAAKVTNALTFSKTGNGADSGTTYNGSAAKTISYNSIGAVPVTTSGTDAQANITNASGEVTITSAENGISVVAAGVGLFSSTQDGMNVFNINENGIFMNNNNVLDESMALTATEIQNICK